MPDTTDHIDRDSEAVGEPAREAAPHASRSAAAGRAFLDALGGDIKSLSGRIAARASRLRRNMAAARLQRSLAAARRRQESAPVTRASVASVTRARPKRSWARTSSRGLRRFAIGVGVVAVVGTLSVFAAMLWALNGLPLDRPMNEADRPSFLLEAANGQPLGRIGPMRAGDVAL